MPPRRKSSNDRPNDGNPPASEAAKAFIEEAARNVQPKPLGEALGQPSEQPKSIADRLKEEASEAVPGLKEVVELSSTKEPKKMYGWRWRSNDRRYGILAITNGDESIYFVRRLSNLVFLLLKLEENRTSEYTVMIGKESHCGCDGYRRYKTCRHIESLTSLHTLGKL